MTLAQRRQRFEELVTYCKNVESQRDKAISALRDAAIGLVDKDINHNVTWSHEIKNKFTVIRAIENVLKLGIKRPEMWW